MNESELYTNPGEWSWRILLELEEVSASRFFKVELHRRGQYTSPATTSVTIPETKTDSRN